MRGVLTTAVVLGLALSGCATKRYARLAPLTDVEAKEYTCRELRIEKAKVEAARHQIRTESNINFMSVMGFLGDFGLGNVNERETAERMLDVRMNDLGLAEIRRDCEEERITGIPGGVALVPASTKSGYCILAAPGYAGTGSMRKPVITSAMPACGNER